MTGKYPLEALIKARGWELEELRGRLAAARAAVDEAERSVRRVLVEIAATESDMLQEGARQGAIAVDKRRLAALFLRDRQDRLREGRDEVSRRRAALAEVMQAIASVRASVRALERHKERLRRRGEDAAAASLAKTMDDLWLGRRSRP